MGPIRKRLPNGGLELWWFHALQPSEFFSGVLTATSPTPDMFTVQSNLDGDVFIEPSVERSKNDLSPLVQHFRFAPRPAELKQHLLLPLGHLNPSCLLWHHPASCLESRILVNFMGRQFSWDTSSALQHWSLFDAAGRRRLFERYGKVSEESLTLPRVLAISHSLVCAVYGREGNVPSLEQASKDALLWLLED